MQKNLYTIFDKKSGTFMQPFVELTDGTATRQCMDLLAQQNSPFAKYPDDFTLMKIGAWDEVEGKPIVEKQIEFIVEFASLTTKE